MATRKRLRGLIPEYFRSKDKYATIYPVTYKEKLNALTERGDARITKSEEKKILENLSVDTIERIVNMDVSKEEKVRLLKASLPSTRVRRSADSSRQEIRRNFERRKQEATRSATRAGKKSKRKKRKKRNTSKM